LPEAPVVVGCDPGRKEVFTYALESGKSGKLSNGQYYHSSHFKKNNFIKKKMLKENNLNNILLQTPTIKTISLQQTILHYQYIQPKFNQILNLKMKKKWRKLNLDSYLMKKKTLDSTIKQIIYETGVEKSNIIVGFGDASFSHTSKGYAASPRRKWVTERMKRIHGLNVIPIWEFNTSRVCANCHSLNGLVDMRGQHISKPHFVRRCANIECGTIWNRDVNASLNMLYLTHLILHNYNRPDYFRKSLGKLRTASPQGTAS
jgi:Putative transposase DNA-binding domain